MWKSGNVEMWKYALNRLIVNVLILVVWKCGNVEICVERFVNLLSLEVWKCGYLEMWKYALNGLIVNLLSLEVWKCGNVEMWIYAFVTSIFVEQGVPRQNSGSLVTTTNWFIDFTKL